MREKQAGEKCVGVSEHRVILSWSVHAGEIPVCCWLLHYINYGFQFEPGTWRIDGMERKKGSLGNGGYTGNCTIKISTLFYKELWKT